MSLDETELVYREAQLTSGLKEFKMDRLSIEKKDFKKLALKYYSLGYQQAAQDQFINSLEEDIFKLQIGSYSQ